VVAADRRLINRGLAFREKTGQEHGAFHLRTRNRRFVMNSTQRAAVDTERRRLFRPLGHDVCAHLSQWRDHAVHGASRERGVTDEATLKCLPGEQASEKSHGRARISTIDFLFRRREHTLLSVNDERVRLGLFDLDP
jgi:hypothetical protein